MTSRQLEDSLRPGVRVKVRRAPDWSGPWPTEPLGIIEPFLGQPFRLVDRVRPAGQRRRERMLREFWVVFDEPQTDGDGDGPYRAAAIWETYLEPIGEGVIDDTPEAQQAREAIDQAWRELSEGRDGVHIHGVLA